MNILYVSMGTSNPWAGPTYSIPKQIKAQSKLDNVFWYDLTISKSLQFQKNVSMWRDTELYHDLYEYPDLKISSLPEPFNHPDIIVVEQFYTYAKSSFLGEIMNSGVPYVIIPRGELTAQAQDKSSLKKKIANLIIFKQFAKKASAIQYLTEQEKIDSGDAWNNKSLIIPNGVTLGDRSKTNFSQDGIKLISIGRIEKYQKGLDLLLEACTFIKDMLLSANVVITICGPDKENQLDELKSYVVEKGLSKIVYFHDAVFGDEKEEMLLESDVFLMTSRFEGHPTALIEALSYGIPCLLTTGSNMRKEVESNNAGWGCDTTSISIKNALCELIKGQSTLRERGIQARKLSEQYDWNAIAVDSHEKYERLILRP